MLQHPLVEGDDLITCCSLNLHTKSRRKHFHKQYNPILLSYSISVNTMYVKTSVK